MRDLLERLEEGRTDLADSDAMKMVEMLLDWDSVSIRGGRVNAVRRQSAQHPEVKLTGTVRDGDLTYELSVEATVSETARIPYEDHHDGAIDLKSDHQVSAVWKFADVGW